MRFVLSLTVAAFVLVAAPQAQSLPDWAAPSYAAESDGPASLVPCPPGQGSDGSGGCILNPPTQVPIDGGLGLLALAGAGLAARRLRRRYA